MYTAGTVKHLENTDKDENKIGLVKERAHVQRNLLALYQNSMIG